MDLSNGEEIETSGSSAKKLKTSDEKKDYISEMPDSILVHILSFLPIGDAIKTVLLRRFGNLWRNISVLDFNDCLYHQCGNVACDENGVYHNDELVGLISNVLNHHNGGTLDKLCLKLLTELNYSEDDFLGEPEFDYKEQQKATSEEIEKLIRYGISRNVKVLDLNFRGCGNINSSQKYNLPDVFRSNCLTDLQLVACDVRSWCNIYMESLKVLLLHEVSLNDDIMKNILLGCPSLEDLSLVNCNGLGKLNCQNPNLKKLVLTLGIEPNQFKLSCPFLLMLDIAGCIAGWIERADLVNVSSLVNASIFFSNYLRDVRLVACDVRSFRNISLKSLRVLLLDEASLSDEIMEKILLGCPLLEDLSLVNCYGLRNINCKNPNLKKMTVILNMDPARLTIDSPYLLLLDIAGWIERATLIDVSSAVDVSFFFSCNFRCAQREYVCFRELLQKVCLCKTFTPCTWSILVFTIWNFKNVPCPKFRCKNLILKLRLTKWHLPGISFLLRSSPSLETLTMFIYPSWGDIFTSPESKWIEDHDFDGENYWDSQEATFPHLKSIMINGYINEPYVIQMVKFLLRSAVRLKKMVISTKESFKPTHQSYIFTSAIEKQKDYFNSEQLLELSNKLLTLPRSSSKAVIYFS